jgi:hypothetical protein
MDKSSRRRQMPVMGSRPIYEWIGSINHHTAELLPLEVDAGKRELLRSWTESQFVTSALRLEDAENTAQVTGRLSRDRDKDHQEYNGVEIARTNTLAALNVVFELAGSQGKLAIMSPEILLDIHSRLRSGFSGLAGNPEAAKLGADTGRGPVQASLAVACHWWTADSFLELHPVEQAAIVHLRLTDLRPFDELTGRASLIASSLFLIRAEMPPVIVPLESVAAYRSALSEAGRMNTQPMVELFAQLTEHWLAEMIRLATTG